MNNCLRIPALAGIVLMTNILLACTDHSPTALPESTPEGADTTAVAPDGQSWAVILGETSAPEGWQVRPCDHPARLCIEADGTLIGTVERFSYPLADMAALPPEATPADVQPFLPSWIADHYAASEQDRQQSGGNLTFVTAAPQSIAIGDRPGLHYGDTATHPNGTRFDRVVGDVTTAGEQLHVFTTGVISGDPSGAFADEAAIATLLPHLDTLIQDLSL